MDLFRWCFIGAGKLANIVADQITASGRHKVVSVYREKPKANTYRPGSLT